MNSSDFRLYRKLLWATVLVGAVAFFWGLGDIPLMSFNEARRALPASAMFSSGDWLLPRLNGELYPAKPPLIYWLSAAVAHLFGSVNEWAARLPSAVAATVIAIVGYRHALRQFGFWPALFTAQLLIANIGFSMFARRAEIEMLLTALCFFSLLSAMKYTHSNGGRAWLWLSYFLLGMAVLTKGPLALLFVTLPLLADALCRRQQRPWQALRDPIGWGVFFIVGSSWYVAVTWQMGFDIWHAIVKSDMLDKVHGSSGISLHNYFIWLMTDFFPASFLLLFSPLATWRSWRSNQGSTTLFLAVIVPLAVFTIFSAKHAKYLLPIYPLLAILLGKRLGELFEVASPAIRRTLLVAGILLPAGFAAFYAVAEPRVFNYRYAAFPAFRNFLAGAGAYPVYGYLDLDERLVYYAQRDIPMLDRAALQNLRAADTPLLLLVEGSRIPEIEPQADCLAREFKPYLKKGKSMMAFGFGSACSALRAGK